MKYQINEFISCGGRGYQEDSYLIIEGFYDGKPWVLAAIADGMGGHINGAAASAAAIEAIREASLKIPGCLWESEWQLAIEATISQAFQDAHKSISLAGGYGDNRGTTMVALFAYSGEAWFFNAGDSFGFTLGPNWDVETVTVPHESEWGAITNCLGGFATRDWGKPFGPPQFITVDVFALDITPGMTLVLASDGILDPKKCLIPQPDYDENLAFPAEADKAENLAEAIGKRGMTLYDVTGRTCDNTTVITIKVIE